MMLSGGYGVGENVKGTGTGYSAGTERYDRPHSLPTTRPYFAQKCALSVSVLERGCEG